jgi:hypothetical protein
MSANAFFLKYHDFVIDTAQLLAIFGISMARPCQAPLPRGPEAAVLRAMACWTSGSFPSV